MDNHSLYFYSLLLSFIPWFVGQLAVCGELLDIATTLKFKEFLPITVPYDIFVTGESLEARLYLAESNTSQAILLALVDSARVTNRDGANASGPFPSMNKWRNITKKE